MAAVALILAVLSLLLHVYLLVRILPEISNWQKQQQDINQRQLTLNGEINQSFKRQLELNSNQIKVNKASRENFQDVNEALAEILKQVNSIEKSVDAAHRVVIGNRSEV